MTSQPRFAETKLQRVEFFTIKKKLESTLVPQQFHELSLIGRSRKSSDVFFTFEKKEQMIQFPLPQVTQANLVYFRSFGILKII